MTPVYGRTNKDCLRACLASILELEYEEIPYVDPDLPTDDFWKEYRIILNQFGFEMVLIDADSIRSHGLKGFSIGIGKTSKGIDHAVICFNGEIRLDPSLSDMEAPEQYLLLVPMCPWKVDPQKKSKNEYILEKTA